MIKKYHDSPVVNSAEYCVYSALSLPSVTAFLSMHFTIVPISLQAAGSAFLITSHSCSETLHARQTTRGFSSNQNAHRVFVPEILLIWGLN